MNFRAAGLALVAAGLCASAATADPPVISNIVPAGVQRGVAGEVTISGGNLAANPRLIAPIPITVEPPAMPGGDAGNWKLRPTVAPETPVGFFPVRVQTDDGISNPFLLAVGQVPNLAEVEPNNVFDGAQSVPLPSVVEGQAAGNDVDYFKFTGLKGQKVLIDAQCARLGSGIDPQIRLTTANRRPVDSVDDTAGLFTDARMVVELPDDGEFVLEFSDTKYQGSGRAVYRLLIGTLPAAEEVYPLGGRQAEAVGFSLRGGTLPGEMLAAGAPKSVGAFRGYAPRWSNHMLGLGGPSDPTYDVEVPTALEVSDMVELREPADPAAPPVLGVPPLVFNGRIETEGDEDRFHVAVTPGQVLRVRVSATDLGSALDAVLRVLNAANNQQVARGDDIDIPPTGLRRLPRKGPGTTSPDPVLDVTVPSGVTELALVISDLAGRGGIGYGYRIEVEPADPAFELQLANDPQISVSKGNTSLVPVNVLRQGYNGPIALTVANPPPGLTVRAGTIGEGHGVGVLSVSAAPDAAFDALILDVQGTGQGPKGPIIESARKQIVFAQQGALPSNVQQQVGLAVAPASSRLLAFDAPGEALEAVHGYPVAVPLKLVRDGDSAKGELTVQPAPLPPGLAVPEVKIGTDALEGSVAVNIDPSFPLGSVTIGMTAKGKIAEKDQIFAVPVVTLNVVRPLDVELAGAKVEIKPGQTVELKGRLVRRGGFKEPVKLNLNGLPAGLKAEPLTVAPDAAEFTFQVIAEANAAAAEANAQVAPAAFKLAEKDYTVPPVALAVKVVP
jgi:hypothetical protein